MVRLTTTNGQTNARNRVCSLNLGRIRLSGFLLALALLFWCAPENSSATDLVDSTQYIVGPGDVFTISFSEASIVPFTTEVGIEGSATIDGVGTFSVAGLTLVSAKAAILGGLEKRFSGSGVELQLTKVREMRTLVAGAVVRPGLYNSKATSLVSDLITDAGGLSANSSRRNIVIRKTSGEESESYPVDLEKFSLVGDPTSNPAVYFGDVIFVPVFTDSMQRCYVSGEVRTPRWIEFTGRDKVLDLIELAGGLSGNARVDSVLLFVSRTASDGESKMVALSDSRVLGPGSRIIALSVGERELEKDVSISGAITNPGRYPYVTGMSVESLIEVAGGALAESYFEGITLFNSSFDRQQIAASLVRTENVSIAEANSFAPSGPSTAGNVRSRGSTTLSPGDSVVVPFAEGFVSVLGQVKAPGLVTFVHARSAFDYIGWAGGTNSWADLSGSYVTRKVAGGATPLGSSDIIYDGDIIFVARKRASQKSSSLGWLRDVALIGAGVALTAFAIDEIGN